MKVTDIKQQAKRADRYSIYIDDAYVFSLGELELMRTGLRIGQELTQAELTRLKDTATLDKAYDRTLNFVAIRPRSEWEIRTYLKRKGYEADITDIILKKLRAAHYVDDKTFARAWVGSRRLLKRVSKRRLQQELRQKRIADDIIATILDEDQTDDRAVLKELVERKKARYPDKLKLMQYLARQGYNYDDIKAVLEEL